MTIFSSSLSNKVALSSATTQTIVQVKSPSDAAGQIIEWGVSFDGVDSADTPCVVQLAYQGSQMTSANSIIPDAWAGQGAQASRWSAYFDSGITAPSELTVIETHFITPIGGLFNKQYPLGREPNVEGGDFFGIQVRASDAVNCVGFIIVDE